MENRVRCPEGGGARAGLPEGHSGDEYLDNGWNRSEGVDRSASRLLTIKR